MSDDASISKRGSSALKPLTTYFEYFGHALTSLYDPVTSPNGYIAMSVAENNLSAPIISERLATLTTNNVKSIVRPDAAAYDSWGGRQGLRKEFATGLAERFITNGAPVDWQKLHVSSGCGSLIEHLTNLLLDEGDGVLLLTPTYPALYNDFCVRAKATVIDIPLDLTSVIATSNVVSSRPPLFTSETLEVAAMNAMKEGCQPKMIFIINPNNPLGILHTRHELETVIAWADRWRALGRGPMHCVFDEIYATSVFGGSFTSVCSILGGGGASVKSAYLGDYNHVLWGFSKDLCLGGARTGVLFTHNESILRALNNVGYFTGVCNVTQDLLGALLEDRVWLAAYIQRNQSQLLRAYDLVQSCLMANAIPFVRASGGLFVWLYLGDCLQEHTWEGEALLTKKLYEDAKVLLTPGQSAHCGQPGWYRCCYAWAKSLDVLSEGLSRLVHFHRTHAAASRSLRLSKL